MNDTARYEGVPTEELRDSVMEDLVKHYSLERISLEEFERRSEIVSKARTRGELVAQVADLPAAEALGRAPRSDYQPRAAATYRSDSPGERQSEVSVAIFGGSDFRGVWRAPRRLTSLCVFGGTNIDLRKAIIPEEGISITCICAFGGADIIVPPGMRVVTRGIGIFGGFDRTNNEIEDFRAPTVYIDGIAVFGGVSVRVKK